MTRLILSAALGVAALASPWKSPPEKSQECGTLIGFSNKLPNSWCQRQCRAYMDTHSGAVIQDFLSSDPEMKWKCHYQSFEIGTDRVIRDECFSNWTMFKAENRPKIYHTLVDIDHPVTCQTSCQEAGTGCVRWEWEWETRNCYLYSRAHARYYTATKSQTVNNPSLSDSLCTGSAKCLYCGGAVTGAVESSDSISGWKWCVNYRDDCRLPSAPQTNYYLGIIRGPRAGERYSFDQRGNEYVYYDQVTGQISETLPA
jgi:hypothetical protein